MVVDVFPAEVYPNACPTMLDGYSARWSTPYEGVEDGAGYDIGVYDISVTGARCFPAVGCNLYASRGVRHLVPRAAVVSREALDIVIGARAQ